ncbi:radical SAM protein [Xylanibacter rodentium]|uniref:radical SAM protein n=2 Tax=Xylanibacter rodentium TaxID=2736289 RepID=UPI002583FECA|nr:radical SAM protein [Xylanibacter rodentium]
MNNILSITPSTLSLITTYKCTSQCADCCFECGPQRKEMLKLQYLINYVDRAINAFPSIGIIVITGGECFLLGDNLYELVKYINSKKLSCRIVTNGYWAKTRETAFDVLSKLKDAGLNEINFSTGDDHLEFVPIEYIKNGIIASMSLNIMTLVNVEYGINRTFDLRNITEDTDIKQYLFPNRKISPLGIVNGLWMPFTKESLQKIEEQLPFNTNKNIGRCENLFNTLTITPNHRMIACCGLPATYIRYLDLGNARTGNLKSLYDNQFNDFLKIWLYVEGPYKILLFISEKIGKENVKELSLNSHTCFYCACIFSNQIYMEIIKKSYQDVYSIVMFKYFILKRRKNEKK